jgi:hypothetical protein
MVEAGGSNQTLEPLELGHEYTTILGNFGNNILNETA